MKKQGDGGDDPESGKPEGEFDLSVYDELRQDYEEGIKVEIDPEETFLQRYKAPITTIVIEVISGAGSGIFVAYVTFKFFT